MLHRRPVRRSGRPPAPVPGHHVAVDRERDGEPHLRPALSLQDCRRTSARLLLSLQV